MKLISYVLSVSLLGAACALGDVYNLALDVDDGITNLWPEQALNHITAENSATGVQSTVVGAEVNDAYFTTQALGAGSGTFRTLFRLQDKGNEQGYNRVTDKKSDFGETSLGPSDSPFIRISDLVTTADGGYYVFSLDANEAGQNPKLVSIDEIRVYTRADGDGDVNTVEDPTTLPGDFANLGDLGTLRYDMNEGGASNTVVMEAGGSGVADIFFFVPTVNFATANDTDLVYLYADHGNYAPAGSSYTFTTTSGFEEWSIPEDAAGQPGFFPVPEPHTALLAVMGGICLMFRRARS